MNKPKPIRARDKFNKWCLLGEKGDLFECLWTKGVFVARRIPDLKFKLVYKTKKK